MVWGTFARLTVIVAALASAGSARANGNDFFIGMGAGILTQAITQGMNQRNNSRQRDDIPYGERRYLDGNNRGGNNRDPERDARIAAQREEARRKAEADRQEMSDIQTRLKMLNFNISSVDGKPGGQTKAAIKAFQASLGARQTGVLDDDQKRTLIAQTSANPAAGVTQPPMAALQPLDVPSTSPPPALPTSNLPAMTSTLPTPGVLQVGSTTPASAVIPDASIFGVKPLQTDVEAHHSLAQANLTPNCQDAQNSIICLNQSSLVTDEIVVGTTSLDTSKIVHTAIRTMTFNPPMDRAKLVPLLSKSYPTLMGLPTRIASTGTDCMQAIEPYRGNDFSALKAWIKSGSQPDESLSRLSARCGYYDEIAIPAGDTVSSISIALFSGQPIANSLSEVGSMDAPAARVENAASPAAPDIRF